MQGPGRGDSPQLARLAIDKSASTAWQTDLYSTAAFGNLYPGTGLLVDMGRTVTITDARVRLGTAPGAGLELRVGSAPSLAQLPVAVRRNGASGVVNLPLPGPVRGRYVLVWFTRLPPDSSGTYQARVYNVRVEGRP